MSTPTQPKPEAAAAARAEIAEFVAAVERELGDLPADDVADLVGGLEADLMDTWAVEGTTPTERFGSPVGYAAELRSSAGLPPRKSPPSQAFSPFARVSSWPENARARLRSQPWWPEISERGLQLRPAWWALRGAVAAAAAVFFLTVFFGTAFGPGLFLVVAVPAALAAVLSMRAGAADAADDPRARRLLTLWNLAAVVVLGWFFVLTASARGAGDASYSESYPTPGLSLDGLAVSNVFPYDAQGNPLSGVRLYDQSGRPLIVGPDGRVGYDSNDVERDVRPAYTDQGPEQWNLYPLQERRVPTGGTPTDYADPAPPYERLAPLPVDESDRPPATPEPSRSGGSTSSPTP